MEVIQEVMQDVVNSAHSNYEQTTYWHCSHSRVYQKPIDWANQISRIPLQCQIHIPPNWLIIEVCLCSLSSFSAEALFVLICLGFIGCGSPAAHCGSRASLNAASALSHH